MHAQIVVLQLTPRLSVRSLVSLKSLNGTKSNGLLLARADMQLLKEAIDLLIFFAS